MGCDSVEFLLVTIIAILFSVQSTNSLRVENGVYSHLTIQIDETIQQPQCDTFFTKIEVNRPYLKFLSRILRNFINARIS